MVIWPPCMGWNSLSLASARCFSILRESEVKDHESLRSRVSRRDFLRTSTGAAAAAAFGGSCASAHTAPRKRKGTKNRSKPNIIYVMLDELGPFELSCLGHDKLETPHIDRMAAEGMLFDQCYGGAPVCAPTRSCLLQGLHGGHTSVRGNLGGISLRTGDATIASVLKNAGYATGGFGKWGVGAVGTEGVPEQHGFDTFFGYYHQIHAHDYHPEYLWRNSVKVPLPGNEDGKTEQFTQSVIFEEAIRFIRRNRERPFFAYLPWTVPHGRHSHFPENDPAWDRFKDKDWPHAAKVYAAMVSMADRQIGEILALLKKCGIDDNTIVFVTGDNGGQDYVKNFFQPNRHLRGFKRDVYEGGLRVPSVVRWPGAVPAGTRSDLVWYFPDVMPTLSEIAGANEHLPERVDGISIAPTLTGRTDQQRKRNFLYWEYRKVADWGKHTYEKDLAQAVRKGDFKAVRIRNESGFELYNLADDPGEKINIASDRPETVAALAAIAKREHEEPPPQDEPKAPGGKRFI